MNYDVTRKVQEALIERLHEALPDIPIWTGEPMADRDTHFKEFAKLLFDEIGTLNTFAIQRFGDYTSFDVAAKKLIAQRAYNLVVMSLSAYDDADPEYIKMYIPKVPDLTEWPPTTVE